MSILQKLSKYIIVAAWRLRLDHLIPDKAFLSLYHRWKTSRKLDWKNPRSYSEKTQWLKLYDHKPEYTAMVDKYLVKQYVADKLGNRYVVPLLGVWDRPEDIEWSKLPDRFVVKCTHDSGGIVICRDKSKLNLDEAQRKLKDAFGKNYYYEGREWPYKNIRKRVFAEQFLEDSSGDLKDYKIFCFDGEPKMIQVDYNRFTGHLRNLYTPQWERIDATICFPTDPDRNFPKPDVLDELLELSRKLSAGIPHVRTDFYIADGKIYFGEITFFPGSGLEKITPEAMDYEMGSWIDLSKVRK